ncbi:CLUMA_CG002337, isoform A [Clunio marinus]|uniref:CLUMA_CG002337, isoform A n=1 Tax=Clunio marinus TaxID=568069 RepID=A0A1J1HQR6_9DIPT|nr:CLUMA_CG002337, isoform A [Clunio marinus]
MNSHSAMQDGLSQPTKVEKRNLSIQSNHKQACTNLFPFPRQSIEYSCLGFQISTLEQKRKLFNF